jgi:hypothetical protein
VAPRVNSYGAVRHCTATHVDVKLLNMAIEQAVTARSRRHLVPSIGALALVLPIGVFLLAVALWRGARSYERPGPSKQTFAENIDFVAYHDLDGKPAFKLALQVVRDRWYLYAAHFWDRGWSILDVGIGAAAHRVRSWSGNGNVADTGRRWAHAHEPRATAHRAAAACAVEGIAWLLLDSILHGPKYLPWRDSPAGVLIWDVRP